MSGGRAGGCEVDELSRLPTELRLPSRADECASARRVQQSGTSRALRSGQASACGQGARMCAPSAISWARASRMRRQPAVVPGSTISSACARQRPEPIDQGAAILWREFVEHIGERHEVMLGVGQVRAQVACAPGDAGDDCCSPRASRPARGWRGWSLPVSRLRCRPQVRRRPHRRAGSCAHIKEGARREVRLLFGERFESAAWMAA